MREHRIVIVGGAVAGMTAARAARRQRPDASITILEQGAYLGAHTDGMPQKLASPDGRLEDLVLAFPDELRLGYAFDVRARSEVRRLDLARRVVVARDHRHEDDFEVPYDTVVLATGALAGLEVPGADHPAAFTLRHLVDGIALKARLDFEHPRTAVIIGAGTGALPYAEALSRRGLGVTVVEQAARVLPRFHPAVSRVVEDELRRHGVKVVTGAAVRAILDGPRGAVVDTTAGLLDAELVLAAPTLRPDVRLAEAAGLRIHPCGAIDVASDLETSASGVYACGECAVTYDRAARRTTIIRSLAAATRQAEVAGVNAAGLERAFPGTLDTEACRVFDVEVARTGAVADVLTDERVPFVVGHAIQRDGAGLFTAALTVGVDGALLGFDLVGPSAVGKRVDVVATALWSGLAASELRLVDLASGPGVAPLVDVVHVAVEAALAEAERRAATSGRDVSSA